MKNKNVNLRWLAAIIKTKSIMPFTNEDELYITIMKNVLNFSTLRFVNRWRKLIDRSFSHYIVLTYFSKLLKLRFLTQYILLTYFSKLLRLRFLTHYILLTYFSKLLRLRFLTHYIPFFFLF